jgi:hypothetical protein
VCNVSRARTLCTVLHFGATRSIFIYDSISKTTLAKNKQMTNMGSMLFTVYTFSLERTPNFWEKQVSTHGATPSWACGSPRALTLKG